MNHNITCEWLGTIYYDDDDNFMNSHRYPILDTSQHKFYTLDKLPGGIGIMNIHYGDLIINIRYNMEYMTKDNLTKLINALENNDTYQIKFDLYEGQHALIRTHEGLVTFSQEHFDDEDSGTMNMSIPNHCVLKSFQDLANY